MFWSKKQKEQSAGLDLVSLHDHDADIYRYVHHKTQEGYIPDQDLMHIQNERSRNAYLEYERLKYLFQLYWFVHGAVRQAIKTAPHPVNNYCYFLIKDQVLVRNNDNQEYSYAMKDIPEEYWVKCKEDIDYQKEMLIDIKLDTLLELI